LASFLFFWICILVTITAFAPSGIPVHISGGRLLVPISATSTTSLFFGLGSVEKQENEYLELAAEYYPPTYIPETVHIVVYNLGTEQEGVHTAEYPKGSGQICLLAFTSEEDAKPFADTLAVGYPGDIDPSAMEYASEQMQQYCQEQGWFFVLVPDTDTI